MQAAVRAPSAWLHGVRALNGVPLYLARETDGTWTKPLFIAGAAQRPHLYRINATTRR